MDQWSRTLVFCLNSLLTSARHTHEGHGFNSTWAPGSDALLFAPANIINSTRSDSLTRPFILFPKNHYPYHSSLSTLVRTTLSTLYNSISTSPARWTLQAQPKPRFALISHSPELECFTSKDLWTLATFSQQL